MFSEIKVFTIGFVLFVMLIMIAGCLMSGSLSDSDLFNGMENSAQAEQMRIENELNAQEREANLPLLEKERAAEHKIRMIRLETEATLAALDGENAIRLRQQEQTKEWALDLLEVRKEEQKLNNREKLAETLNLILLVFGITIGVAAGVVVILAAYRKIFSPLSLTRPAFDAEASVKPFPQVWDKPDYRQDRINQARSMESKIRALQLQGKQPDATRQVYPWRT